MEKHVLVLSLLNNQFQPKAFSMKGCWVSQRQQNSFHSAIANKFDFSHCDNNSPRVRRDILMFLILKG